MASGARRPTVLIVLHQEHSTPGRVGYALRATDVRLDIRRPSVGEPMPKSLAEHDGVVVFGGPMCANDDCDWIRREIDWLDVPLAEEKPFLGICLGAQMLARALGARVFTYEDRRSEVGYFAIKPNAAGDRLCAERFPRSVFNGIPTASTCRRAPNCSPPAARIFPIRPTSTAGPRSGCSSTPRSPTT